MAQPWGPITGAGTRLRGAEAPLPQTRPGACRRPALRPDWPPSLRQRARWSSVGSPARAACSPRPWSAPCRSAASWTSAAPASARSTSWRTTATSGAAPRPRPQPRGPAPRPRGPALQPRGPAPNPINPEPASCGYCLCSPRGWRAERARVRRGGAHPLALPRFLQAHWVSVGMWQAPQEASACRLPMVPSPGSLGGLRAPWLLQNGQGRVRGSLGCWG